MVRGNSGIKKKKLNNEELNDLHSSSNIVWLKKKKSEMCGDCRTYGERRGVYRVFMGQPERKRPLVSPRRRWEDNIKMDLRKWDVGYELDRVDSG